MFEFFKKKRKVMMVNDILTVTFKNSNQLVFHNADRHLYDVVSNPGTTDEEIVNLYYDLLEKEKEKRDEQVAGGMKSIIHQKEAERQAARTELENAKDEVAAVEEVKSGFPSLVETGDFIEKDGVVYMKDIPNLSIPDILVRKLVSVVRAINDGDNSKFEEYNALRNFWRWSTLCPNPQSREDLFKFIETNGLKVNKNGFFFAYRKIVSCNNSDTIGNKELIKFISNSWLKIKAQKKGPKNFWVLEDDSDYDEDPTYLLSKDRDTDLNIVGNLAELYERISTDSTVQDNCYTDAYTHKMNIVIGKEVSIEADKCDWNNLEACSNGLHIRGDRDHGCGDTTILVLVNPMNSVAVPVYDDTKMRVRAYLPVAILNEGEDAKILRELDTLEIADEYLSEQVDNLQMMVQNNTPTELVEHRLVANLSSEALKLITKQVVNIKDTLTKRVVTA